MAEPQPTDPSPPQPPRGQAAAESAALSNLTDASDPSAESTTPSKSDTAALNNAISNLSVGSSGPLAASKPAAEAAKAEPAKKVKIDAADVSWLVSELEVSKTVATGMLRAAEGKKDKAVEEFVLPRGRAAAASA